MTSPIDSDLMTLATPYALHAVSETERAEIERRIGRAAPATAQAFRQEVRAVGETMAILSAATAVEPSPGLRERVLDAVMSPSPRRTRWRTVMLAAAAAIIAAAGAVLATVALRPPQPPSTAEQVLTAPDVRSVVAPMPPAGTATLVYSRAKNAGMLVMDNVDPPPPGTVYQMWLLDGQQPRSAGTLRPVAVGASATAILRDIEHSSALAFTVEPGRGSEQPTTRVLAQLSLT